MPNCFKRHILLPASSSAIIDPWPAWPHYPFNRISGNPINFSLLLVSKTTFLESFHIFYRSHTLYFQDTDTLILFLRNIGYARRQQILDIGFDWVGTGSRAAFCLLKTCGMLKSLRFSLHGPNFCGYEALREVRGLKQIIRLRVSPFEHGCTRSWCAISIDEHDEGSGSEPWAMQFDDLQKGMMRPRTLTDENTLARKNGKTVLLGGKRE